ncbi:MAG TPA: hypothetical protein PKY13_01560 [Microthrixaceae bacterium]|jgi:hypothetical protein|nr:hypothetical protein [Microthrixaceae bacterium]HQF92819.1 hypothetical protein [Microthrixaceae bacterium]
MRIQAIAVFERVVHQCHALSLDRPERPVLEVDAILREGDAEGELLLPVPTFMALLGGPAKANDALQHLAVNGRIVDHQEIAHIRFPLWERIDSSATG